MRVGHIKESAIPMPKIVNKNVYFHHFVIDNISNESSISTSNGNERRGRAGQETEV